MKVNKYKDAEKKSKGKLVNLNAKKVKKNEHLMEIEMENIVLKNMFLAENADLDLIRKN